jgi:hypothetical protein
MIPLSLTLFFLFFLLGSLIEALHVISSSFPKPAFRPSKLFATPVSTVSVCTAELCRCQEEGFGADDILSNLLSLDLPYPIDEAPCLGACGAGAMVAIDFEDGTCALVSGLEETLFELGLVGQTVPDGTPASSLDEVETVEDTAPVAVESITAIDVVVDLAASRTIGEIDLAPTTTIVEIELPAEPAKTLSTPPPPPPAATKKFEDARDRMRAEAAKDDQQNNPWFNAAAYLAEKAREKILGKE